MARCPRSTSLRWIRSSSPDVEGQAVSKPPLLKQLVCNQLDAGWALNPDEYDTRSYAGYIRNLIGYIAEKDAAWALNFIFNNVSKLLDVFGYEIPAQSQDDLRPLAECLRASATTCLLVELGQRRPDLYSEMMDSQAALKIISGAAVTWPTFHLSKLPPHSSISGDFLAQILTDCAMNDWLDHEKYSDLASAWLKNGGSGSLVAYAVGTDITEPLRKGMQAYELLTKGDGCKAELILGLCSKFEHVGKNFDFLDELLEREAGLSCLRSSPGHQAFMMASGRLTAMQIIGLPVEEITIGVALRMFKDNKRDDFKGFIKRAFREDASRAVIRKLDKTEVDLAISLRFFNDDLRKIDWEDRRIKGTLIEEDLGI